jgi:repressor LexA
MVENKKDLGLLVKKARKIKSEKIKKRYTQKMLATDIGISQGYIGDIESGRTYPTVPVLTLIANACEVPFGFFGNADHSEIDIVQETSSASVADTVKLNRIKEFTPINILGVIRAGEPMYAEQNVIDQLGIPDNQLNHGGTYFGLLVTGDSMNNSGILDGSYVVVREQEEVENGETAVVLVDGENATVKIFYRTDTTITLIPNSSNSEHKPRMIDLTKTEVKVIGKVIMTMNIIARR